MLKILIAEDDRELCRLFSHVLTKNGYSVKGVSNGREALDELDKEDSEYGTKMARLMSLFISSGRVTTTFPL